MSNFTGTHQMLDALASTGAGDGLAAIRKLAQTRFSSMEWPQMSEEEWRRTKVSELPLDSLAWMGHGQRTAQGHGQDAPAMNWFQGEDPWAIGDTDTGCSEPAMVIEGFDGLYCLASSDGTSQGSLEVYNLTDGTNLTSQSRVPGELIKAVHGLLEKEVAGADTKFIPWNLALHRTAILIHVKKDAVLSGPVLIQHGFSSGELAHFPLVIALLESGAELELVQRIAGADEGLVNFTQFNQLGANAKLRSHVIQDLADSTVYVSNDQTDLKRDSDLVQVGAWLGGGLCKVRSTANLLDVGTNAHLDGIYLGRDTQHMDIRSVQNHLSPRANSRALYKGVVRDESRTIYQGMIYVAPGAAKTDAYLTNNNMVLNDGARADSIPCLNIMTDDVKCSHGSTTGKLPEGQIFYLKTRGFSLSEATKFLVNAYLREVSDRVPACVRSWLGDKVADLIASGD